MCLNKRISGALPTSSEAVYGVIRYMQEQKVVGRPGEQWLSQQFCALQYN